ncbi:zinc finger protein 665 isoform X2 [Nilaparvata lugens]|nr:zinc finger protein 665 isoform X2 [Nilaparvata lugens]
MQQVTDDHQQAMYQDQMQGGVVLGEEDDDYEDVEEEEEEDMCEEEEEDEEGIRFNDGLVKDGVMDSNTTIDNTTGYVECLVPQKDGDGMSNKRKKHTPVKCFNGMQTKTESLAKVEEKVLEVITVESQLHDNQQQQLILQQHLQHQQLDDQANINEQHFINGESYIVKDIESQQQQQALEKQQQEINWEIMTLRCTECPDELASLEALREHHAVVHKQETRFLCTQCTKVFTNQATFFAHIKRHRNLEKYNCAECGKYFSTKRVFEMHSSTHSNTRPYVCHTCGKAFRLHSALFMHSRCHLPEEVKNKYACDQCDKRFTTKPNLVTHKRIHTGIRNFTCDQCGKGFIQKGNLDAHLMTHSQDKPFHCDICNKGFKTTLHLRKHASVHTGAKPYQCQECGRHFRERGTLREHLRIHTGDMPFTCEYCGKAFRFKGILTTHRRQHTGERPYSCFECEHHFTNWPNYNKHMKRRHGINLSRATRVKIDDTVSNVIQSAPAPTASPTDLLRSAQIQQLQQPLVAEEQNTLYKETSLHPAEEQTTLYKETSLHPAEDLSDRSNHFYSPVIVPSSVVPMAATYVTTSHHNMLGFYNLTQIQTLDTSAPIDMMQTHHR